MVVSMLLALTTCPAMLGSQEAIRQSQTKERREEHRARRCNLIATCVKPSIRSREINGRQVVLKNSKVYIDTGTSLNGIDSENEAETGHPFAGYFLPYPDSDYEGLVSTTTSEAPILNWIYVDNGTHEVKYGIRDDAQPHVTGPFDCTRLDRRMVLEGWEGFCAVEEYPAVWALYFDRNDDGLTGKVPFGTRILEVELSRREKKLTQEVLKEQQREQAQLQRELDQQGHSMEQGQNENGAEWLQPEGQNQAVEEDADDEDQSASKMSERSSQALEYPIIVGKLRSQPRPVQIEDVEDETHGNNGFTEDGFENTGFAALRPTTEETVSSTGSGETTTDRLTDTGCGTSIWSHHEKDLRPTRINSAAFSAFSEDDEIAVSEALFRQNESIGE